jgi:hypothetical protein
MLNWSRFLLAKLRTEYILEFSDPNDMESHLRDIPNTVHDAYQNRLDRVEPNNKQLTLRILGLMLRV